jgi:hypothetical protein
VTADFLFVDAEPLGHLHLAYALLAHGHVQSRLGHSFGRRSNQVLSALGFARRREVDTLHQVL